MSALGEWWRRNVIDSDPQPEYSTLDLLDVSRTRRPGAARRVAAETAVVAERPWLRTPVSMEGSPAMTLIRTHTDICPDGEGWAAFCSHESCAWSAAGCRDEASARFLAQQHDETH